MIDGATNLVRSAAPSCIPFLILSPSTLTEPSLREPSVATSSANNILCDSAFNRVGSILGRRMILDFVTAGRELDEVVAVAIVGVLIRLPLLEVKCRLCDRIASVLLGGARGDGNFGDDVNRAATNLRNLLSSSDRDQVAESRDRDQSCSSAMVSFGFAQLELWLGSSGHKPITPKASNEEFGWERSGICSRFAGVIAESPYMILTGCAGRCPLVTNGWIIRPSTAAQMMILRAIPGIVRCGTTQGVCAPEDE